MLFCMPLRCNLSTFLPSLGTDPAVPPGSIQVARSTICRKQRISMCQESWVSTVAILAQGTHSGRCGNAGLFVSWQTVLFLVLPWQSQQHMLSMPGCCKLCFCPSPGKGRAFLSPKWGVVGGLQRSALCPTDRVDGLP